VSIVFEPLEEILDAARAAKEMPVEIRVGANQMREFRQWAARSAGAPDEYDGIPVVEIARDNRRSYINGQGRMVVVD
jgi:hypothetical protein